MPAIALEYDSLEAAPEALRPLLSKSEAGKFIGKVVPSTEHDQFRDNNRELFNKLGAFEGIDPTKVKAEADRLKQAETELQKLRDAAQAGALGKTPEEFEKAFQDRYGRALEDHNSKLEAEQTAKRKLEEQLVEKDQLLCDRVLDGDVDRAVARIDKFYAPAIGDAKLLARNFFRVENGVAVAREGNRSNGKILFGPDGVTPLTVEDWLRGKKAWQLSGVNGGDAPGGAGINGNPKVVLRTTFDGWDPAAQMKFIKDGGRPVDHA